MEGNMSVHMGVGQKIRIEIPVITTGAILSGHFATKETTIDIGGSTKSVTNGFFLDNDLVGSLIAVPNCPAVIYTHKQPYSNTIYFKGTGDKMATIDIIGASVHDHTSIYQGGPAHGTYSSEPN
jgi:hypothetical protein